MSFGYQGKILHLNLNGPAFTVETPPDTFYRQYLGGSALAAHYLLTLNPPRIDPFSSENTLVVAVGVLTGVPIAGQSRITAAAKSPLTGAVGDSQSGGFFPAELKFAGFDAVVIQGASEKPVYLWIDEGEYQLRPAEHLMGKPTLEVEQAIKSELGDPKIHILQTGIAGENRVRFASLISLANRANGRTGMGAVMGAKNLKAIAVRGSQKPKVYAPAAVKALARWGAKEFPNSDVYAMGKYGTAEVVAYQNHVGGLPTHNWASGAFEGWEALDGRTMSKTILIRRDTCFACAIRCKRVVENEKGPYQINPAYGGPEYETLSTLGSYCDVDDLEAVALANQLCNLYGMDTISCGATIAWAMEAFEQGMLTLQDTEGIDLQFGNAQAMIEVVGKIARREGIGSLLAEGSARAARALGQGSEDLTVTVKGQEVPAHMPQVKPSLGVIYAVNPFGADHQSSEHDPSFAGYPERMSQLGLDQAEKAVGFSDETVRYALTTQHLYSALDSASVCQFVYGPAWQLYDSRQLTEAIQAVTSWDFDVKELLTVGERRLNMLQAYNIREGFTRDDDRLPKKFFQALKGGASHGKKLSQQEIETAKDSYYRMAGWDKNSAAPGREKLFSLGLAWVADMLTPD